MGASKVNGESREREDGPSKSPSPSTAFDGWQYHDRSFMRRRPSFSVTSVGVMAFRERVIPSVAHTYGCSPPQAEAEAPALLTSGQVLLVGKHEQQAVLHLSVVQDLVQLLPRLVDPFAVLRVDDKDEPLRAGVVVPPEGADLVLAADVLGGAGSLLVLVAAAEGPEGADAPRR